MTISPASFVAFTRRFRGDAQGNLTVEFAFLIPFLLALSFGALELGNVLLQHLRLTGAARAGLQYGLQNDSTAVDYAGIERAARAGAGSVSGGYSVTARKFCSCTSGEVSCSTSCSDDSEMRTYVEVAVEGDVAPLISYPIAVPTWHLSARQARRLN